jgi:hypothetical protein
VHFSARQEQPPRGASWHPPRVVRRSISFLLPALTPSSGATQTHLLRADGGVAGTMTTGIGEPAGPRADVRRRSGVPNPRQKREGHRRSAATRNPRR